MLMGATGHTPTTDALPIWANHHRTKHHTRTRVKLSHSPTTQFDPTSPGSHHRGRWYGTSGPSYAVWEGAAHGYPDT